MNKFKLIPTIFFTYIFISNLSVIASSNSLAAGLINTSRSRPAGSFSIRNVGPYTPVTIEDIEWNYCRNNGDDVFLKSNETYQFSWKVGPLTASNCALKRIRFRIEDQYHYTYYFTFGNAIVPKEGRIDCIIYPNEAKAKKIQCKSIDSAENSTLIYGKSLW